MTLVSGVRASMTHGGHRAAAAVDGVELWYESTDVKLAPSPEAFATALLVPALHRARPLRLDCQLSETWIDNAERLVVRLHDWWGYPRMIPDAELRPPVVRERAERVGLCFSGGVDSFYTLLHDDVKPQLLVSVHGFDIALADKARMENLVESVRKVATEFDARAVAVSTNFRSHPDAGRAGRPKLWERLHGGALASIGHVLEDHVTSLVMSSSVYRLHAQPWGSSFEIDHFWSSDKVRISSYGADAMRDEKVIFLAKEALPRQHLRVCWENRSSAGNCSRCEKCVLTMVMLAGEGVLDDFKVFDSESQLPDHVDALPYLTDFIGMAERTLDRGGLRRETERATRRLIRRSQVARRVRRYTDKVRKAMQ